MVSCELCDWNNSHFLSLLKCCPGAEFSQDITLELFSRVRSRRGWAVAGSQRHVTATWPCNAKAFLAGETKQLCVPPATLRTKSWWQPGSHILSWWEFAMRKELAGTFRREYWNTKKSLLWSKLFFGPVAVLFKSQAKQIVIAGLWANAKSCEF